MLPELLARLAGPWHADVAGAGIALEPPLFGLKVGQADDPADRLRFIVFGSGDGRPSVVLKVAGGPTDQQQLEHEHRVLQDISAIAALRSTVPRPIGLWPLADRLVLAMSALPGTPLDVRVRRRECTRPAQLQEALFRAQVWVQLLQSATVAEPMVFAGRAAVEQRLGELAGTGVREQLPPAFLEALLAEADALQGLRLPIGGRHGDFQPTNVLEDAGRIGVVDWEQYRCPELGCPDIFQFAIGLARAYLWTGWHRPTTREAFHFAFLQGGFFSVLVDEYVSRFLRAMGMPEDGGHLFLSLFLMDMAAGQAAWGSRRQSVGRASMWLKTLVAYGEHAPTAALAPPRLYRPAQPPPATVPGPTPTPPAPTTIDLTTARKRRRWIS